MAFSFRLRAALAKGRCPRRLRDPAAASSRPALPRARATPPCIPSCGLLATRRKPQGSAYQGFLAGGAGPLVRAGFRRYRAGRAGSREAGLRGGTSRGGRGLGAGRGRRPRLRREGEGTRGEGRGGEGGKGKEGEGRGGRPRRGSESPDSCPRGPPGSLAAVSRAASRLGSGEWLACPGRPSPAGSARRRLARGLGRRPVRGGPRAGPGEAVRETGAAAFWAGGIKRGPRGAAAAPLPGSGLVRRKGRRVGAPWPRARPAPLFTGPRCTLSRAGLRAAGMYWGPGARSPPPRLGHPGPSPAPPPPPPIPSRRAARRGCDTSAPPARPARLSIVPPPPPTTLGSRRVRRAICLPSAQPGCRSRV